MRQKHKDGSSILAQVRRTELPLQEINSLKSYIIQRMKGKTSQSTLCFQEFLSSMFPVNQLNIITVFTALYLMTSDIILNCIVKVLNFIFKIPDSKKDMAHLSKRFGECSSGRKGHLLIKKKSLLPKAGLMYWGIPSVPPKSASIWFFLQQRRKHILLHASKAACLLFLTIQENVIQWKQKGTKIIQKVYGNCDKFILVQKLWNPCPHFLMVFKRFLTQLNFNFLYQNKHLFLFHLSTNFWHTLTFMPIWENEAS